jgi:D-sedoheptulose 7-phosphate isomerase
MTEKQVAYFFNTSMEEAKLIAEKLKDQTATFSKMVSILQRVRNDDGRVFILGVGGGAGNGTHLAGDLFKSASLNVICLTDNIPTITAITNDEGWENVFSFQLRNWRCNEKDAIFIFSVGGGDAEKNISVNLINAIDFVKSQGSKILGVVGKAQGYTAKNGDAVIIVPVSSTHFFTCHTESWQAYLGHLLTEALRLRSAKWESVI